MSKIVVLKKPLTGGVYDDKDPYQNVTVTLDEFTFDTAAGKETRWRPTKATGGVEQRDGARASGELSPIVCKRPDGTFEDTPAPFAAGGHLIADILSGPNDPENLVPVSCETNDRMREIESKIRSLIKRAGAGAGAILTVTITSYYEQDPRIPKTFVYTLEVDDPESEDESESDSEIFSEKGLKRSRSEISSSKSRKVSKPKEHSFNLTQNFLVVRDYDKRHKQFNDHMKLLEDEMDNKGWTVEEFFKSKDPQIAEAMKKVPLERRQYAVLDYFFLVKKGKGYVSAKGTYDYAKIGSCNDWYGTGCEFDYWQKQLMLKLMYGRNDGYLCSDVYGLSQKNETGVPVKEDYENLIHGAAGCGPAFDHIWPVAKGGPNLFSNAQIVSSSFNSKKGSKF